MIVFILAFVEFFLVYMTWQTASWPVAMLFTVYTLRSAAQGCRKAMEERR